MGCIDTITYEKFPKQKDENYKYPKFKVGSRVKVCYHYDTSKYHYGTIVRDDLEEPFETIIKLDNGRYLRAVECQFSYIDEEVSDDVLLRLPCKVGDTVYVKMASYCDIQYAEAEVRDFTHFTSCGFCAVVTSKHFDKQNIPFSEFGKTVFLTQAEAEQKLKEMERD